MKKLQSLIEKLEQAITEYKILDPKISLGSVGWHIEHSLLTLNLVIEALKRSEPDEYKWSFNIKRSFVLLSGKIPRGRIKAPTVVRPTINYNAHTLKQHILLTKEKMKSMGALKSHHFFNHPFLGDLRFRSTVRFLNIHTKHHLAIINDIIKNKKSVEK